MDSKHVEALFAVRKALESGNDDALIQYWLERADTLIGRDAATDMFLAEAKKRYLPDE